MYFTFITYTTTSATRPVHQPLYMESTPPHSQQNHHYCHSNIRPQKYSNNERETPQCSKEHPHYLPPYLNAHTPCTTWAFAGTTLNLRTSVTLTPSPPCSQNHLQQQVNLKLQVAALWKPTVPYERCRPVNSHTVYGPTEQSFTNQPLSLNFYVLHEHKYVCMYIHRYTALYMQ